MNDTANHPSATSMTIGQLRESLGVKESAFRMAFGRQKLLNYNQARPATAEEIRVMSEYYTALRNQPTKPAPKAATPPARSTAAPTAQPAPSRKPAAKRWKWPAFQAELFDVVIWCEMILGFYSLVMLTHVPGAIAGLVIFVFFEQVRRTMRRRPRATEAAQGTAEHNAASEYNTALARAKTFAFVTVATIAVTFMVCNYQTFLAVLKTQSDFATTTVWQQYTVAQCAAAWLAFLMSGIAYLSLRGLSLSNNLKALQ